MSKCLNRNYYLFFIKLYENSDGKTAILVFKVGKFPTLTKLIETFLRPFWSEFSIIQKLLKRSFKCSVHFMLFEVLVKFQFAKSQVWTWITLVPFKISRKFFHLNNLNVTSNTKQKVHDQKVWQRWENRNNVICGQNWHHGHLRVH